LAADDERRTKMRKVFSVLFAKSTGRRGATEVSWS
jgi:hypothetical protein